METKISKIGHNFVRNEHIFKLSRLSANLIKVSQAMVVIKVFTSEFWVFRCMPGGLFIHSQGHCFQDCLKLCVLVTWSW